MRRKRFIILTISVFVVLILGLFILSEKKALDDVSFSYAVLDRNGEIIRVFLSVDEKYRIRQELSDFPSQFIELILLKEDQYFYAHPGINPAALFKAAWASYVVRERRIGASTITMQLARLKYGLFTRTIPGKIKQIISAFYLEIKYSKQEILEAYLNLAPCGGNIEGFPAAAYYYFHK
ncbi:MAG: transglycosylase domain-containing protein, partial [Spirochaetales bacterium]|nr:transglycosylase domain-containing protein [Spirochaetales bacterium]